MDVRGFPFFPPFFGHISSISNDIENKLSMKRIFPFIEGVSTFVYVLQRTKWEPQKNVSKPTFKVIHNTTPSLRGEFNLCIYLVQRLPTFLNHIGIEYHWKYIQHNTASYRGKGNFYFSQKNKNIISTLFVYKIIPLPAVQFYSLIPHSFPWTFQLYSYP